MQRTLSLFLALAFAFCSPAAFAGSARKGNQPGPYGISSAGIGSAETIEYLLQPNYNVALTEGTTSLYLSSAVAGGDYAAGVDSADCTDIAAPCTTWDTVVDDCTAANGCDIYIDAGDAAWLAPGAGTSHLQLTSDVSDPRTRTVQFTIRSSRVGTAVTVNLDNHDGSPGVFHLTESGGDDPGIYSTAMAVFQDITFTNADNNDVMICDSRWRCIFNRVTCPSVSGAPACAQFPGGNGTFLNSSATGTNTAAGVIDINEYGRVNSIGSHWTQNGNANTTNVVGIIGDTDDNAGSGDTAAGMAAIRSTFTESNAGALAGATIIDIGGDNTSNKNSEVFFRAAQSLITGADADGQSCFEFGQIPQLGHLEVQLFQSSLYGCSYGFEWPDAATQALATNLFRIRWSILALADATTSRMWLDQWGTGTTNRYTHGLYHMLNNVVVEPNPVATTFLRVRGTGDTVHVTADSLSDWTDTEYPGATWTADEENGLIHFFMDDENTATNTDPYNGQTIDANVSCTTDANCTDQLTDTDAYLFELATPLDRRWFPNYGGPDVTHIVFGERCKDSGYDGECY